MKCLALLPFAFTQTHYNDYVDENTFPAAPWHLIQHRRGIDVNIFILDLILIHKFQVVRGVCDGNCGRGGCVLSAAGWGDAVPIRPAMRDCRRSHASTSLRLVMFRMCCLYNRVGDINWRCMFSLWTLYAVFDILEDTFLLLLETLHWIYTLGTHTEFHILYRNAGTHLWILPFLLLCPD